MERLAVSDLRRLLTLQSASSSPCVSLYLPLAGSDADGARRRLQALLERARAQLARHYPAVPDALARAVGAMAERLPRVGPGRGLAVFWSRDVQGYVPLPARVGELAVVAESFHVKPLLALLQGQERYYVLALGAAVARFYEGHGGGLEEKEVFFDPRADAGARRGGRADAPLVLPSPRETSRFYRDVERRLRGRLRGRDEPLLVVGAPALRALHGSVSRLRNRLDHPDLGVPVHGLSALDLHARAWPHVEANGRRRRLRVARDYHLARLKRLNAERLDEVARAAVTGNVATYMVPPVAQEQSYFPALW